MFPPASRTASSWAIVDSTSIDGGPSTHGGSRKFQTGVGKSFKVFEGTTIFVGPQQIILVRVVSSDLTHNNSSGPLRIVDPSHLSW